MMGVKCSSSFVFRQDFLGIYKLVGVKSVKDMYVIIREQLPYLGLPGSPCLSPNVSCVRLSLPTDPFLCLMTQAYVCPTLASSFLLMLLLSFQL